MGVWMRMKGTAGLALCAVFGVMLACPAQADAASKRGTHSGRQAASASHSPASAGRAHQASSRVAHAGSRHTARSSRRGGGYAASGGISCVPYARMVTGMQISGNGGRWWYNAAGAYDRGQRPEPGSVLAFASSGGMRSGHVAVVNRIHGPRHIEIDHANWGGPGIRRGTVMRNVDVIDVSERNDWTAVRVQVGWEQGAFGRTYPTYGFIHNRPDRGMMASMTGGSMAASARTVSARLEEVAELPRTTPTRTTSRRRAR
jgi:surface antigen